MQVHHVGYLVKDINKSIETFEDIGYVKSSEICFDQSRRINLCFLENNGYMVELVCPVNNESVAWKLLKKYGNSPYHICYETENLESGIERLTNKGYVVTAEPEVAIGINGLKVAFLMGRDMGLIELVECKEFKWEKNI